MDLNLTREKLSWCWSKSWSKSRLVTMTEPWTKDTSCTALFVWNTIHSLLSSPLSLQSVSVCWLVVSVWEHLRSHWKRGRVSSLHNQKHLKSSSLGFAEEPTGNERMHRTWKWPSQSKAMDVFWGHHGWASICFFKFCIAFCLIHCFWWFGKRTLCKNAGRHTLKKSMSVLLTLLSAPGTSKGKQASAECWHCHWIALGGQTPGVQEHRS